MHDFESSDPVHLPFHKDEVLTIIKQEHSGWWAAMRPQGDRIGWIPGSFVHPLDRSKIVECPDETPWPYESNDPPLSVDHDPSVLVPEDYRALSSQLVTPTDLVLYDGMGEVCVPPTPESPVRSDPSLLFTANPPCEVDDQAPLLYLTAPVSLYEIAPDLISSLDIQDWLVAFKSVAASQEGTYHHDCTQGQLPASLHLARPNQGIPDINLLDLTIWGPDNLAEQFFSYQDEPLDVTVCVKNAAYETNSEDVRRSFEEHGEIKTFFDLVSTRGMVFVTYYDLRAAERARERLQGSEIGGRPIDVHYSLPRDDQKQGGDREKNQQYQGCLIVTLKDSRQIIDDNEVRRKFQQFGDVKSVMPVGDRADQRYVEYYDMRNCDEAFDRLRHQGLQDGTMDIIYAWEESEMTGPATQRGGRGGGRGYGGDRGGYGGDRFDARPPYSAGGSYNEPTSTTTTYNQPPPGLASSQTPEDRLEQARRVQQLLAALKQPQTGTAPPLPTQPAPPTLQMPPMAQPPPSATSYYPPPSMQQPAHSYAAMPTQSMSPYAQMPPQTQTPQPGQGPPGMGTLPPNILALLQQSSSQQPPLVPQQSSAPQYGMPPPPPQMMSPPPMSSLPPGAPQPGGPGYQQLMAFLQASQKRG
ncbi:hypothetical protein J3R82DRAFT_331, partial [Butyriboletus roseoflavus]